MIDLRGSTGYFEGVVFWGVSICNSSEEGESNVFLGVGLGELIGEVRNYPCNS